MALRRISSMKKFSPVKEPIHVAPSAEQLAQRTKDEKSAYKDLYSSVHGQLNAYSDEIDMAAHGGSILEDLRTWEALLQNKSLNPNTMDLIRTSLHFQHTLNIAFGRLSTALSTTVCTKLDHFAKDGKEAKGELKIKEEKEIMRLMQESEERLIGVFENYWKCYIEFFRQGYQLGVNIKNYFVKFHPEEPIFYEIPKGFGKELSKIWEDESDLRIAIYILKYFEEFGSDETVLKNNVPPETVKPIIQALEKGLIPLTGSSEAMAHVLLHWINSLSDPIFPQSMLKDFLDTANMVNLQPKKEKMAALINKLPKPNRIVLLAVIRGCLKIAREKSVGNLRYTQILLERIADLAAALGPSLTRCNQDQVPLSLALLRYLVLNSELFFPLGCDEERHFVAETNKLGRVVKLAGELSPPPSLITPVFSSSSSPSPSPSSEHSSSPKSMKIGERNSSKAHSSFFSPSFSLSPSISTASTTTTATSIYSSSSSSALHVSSSTIPIISPSSLSLSPSPSPSPSTPPFLSRSFTETFVPSKKRTSPVPPSPSPPPPRPSISPSPSSLVVSTDEDGMYNITNNFITNNNVTNNTITNNITNIIIPSPLSSPSPSPSASPASSPTTIPSFRASGIGIGTRTTLPSPSLSFAPSMATATNVSPAKPPALSTLSSLSPSLSPAPSSERIEYAGLSITSPRKSTDDLLKAIGDETITDSDLSHNNKNWDQVLQAGHISESVEKLAKDVMVKISRIHATSEKSEIFEDAFPQVLKLKRVVPEVEKVKAYLQMGMEFDQSELAKARGDKLARVKTTVQIFAREISNVMETVISIFGTSVIPPETRVAVGTSLERISAQLS